MLPRSIVVLQECANVHKYHLMHQDGPAVYHTSLNSFVAHPEAVVYVVQPCTRSIRLDTRTCNGAAVSHQSRQHNHFLWCTPQQEGADAASRKEQRNQEEGG